MRVLITGSGGYIGAVLAPLVAGAGHDVLGFDAMFYEGCDFGDARVSVPTRRGDVRDVMKSDLKGFDAVLHLAALSNDPVGDLNEDWTYEVNLEGSIRLATAARDAGVRRFVFASSCSMYGASGTDVLLDENSPFNPLTAYAESKVRAEAALRDLADDGFATVSMRNATVYGLSSRLRLDIVLNNLAAWAHTTGAIRLLSDGTAWRPLVHVRDLAAAALAILEAPDDLVNGEAFNVGSNEQNYLVRDLAEVLSALTGCEVEYARDASHDPRSYRVDFSKLSCAFPDLRFEWDAERGGAELINAYRAAPLTSDLFDGRLYVRLRQLRHLLETGALTEGLRWQVP